MRILVTGNMGYIGPRVVAHLSRVFPGAELIGVGAGFFAHCLVRPGSDPEQKLTRQIHADVRTLGDEVFEGVDGVVHLAAISNDPMGNEFEKVTLAINHTASVDVARKARKAGVKNFVFASSCSIYGGGGESVRTESSPLDPLTAYAKSKVLAERDLEDLATGNFTVTCLRFATACGYSPRCRLDLVLNDFVASALTTGKITLLSDGTAWRPLIHVSDMARAMEWALTRTAKQGGRFLAVNTGADDQNYQVKDLAEMVKRELTGVEISYAKNAQPDKRSYRVSFELFRTLAPRHQPVTTLEAAVGELVEELAEVLRPGVDFRNSNFIRLKVLRDLIQTNQLNSNLEWTEMTRMAA